MGALFIPQPIYDAWDSDGKVTVEARLVRLASGEASFTVEPAVRFTKSVGRPGDPLNLIGAVRRIEDLAGLGGDHYLGSVLIGDNAYEVDEGYLATPAAGNGGKPLTPSDDARLRQLMKSI
jgi:hypothetical protein